jgi:glycerophosphoryl diester phosphodiesterase
LVVAHRGLGFDAPEHSLEGYQRSLAAGADGFEVDVHLSRDGQLFCVHDASLERTHSLNAQIGDLNYDELVELGVTPLWQALALIKDFSTAKGILIETKHPVTSGGLVEHRLRADLTFYDLNSSALDISAMKQRQTQTKPWVVPMSFSMLAIRRIARLMPFLPSVYLFNQSWSFGLPQKLLPQSSYLGPSVSLMKDPPEVANLLLKSQRPTFIWTVDEPQHLEKCFETGVTCVITDDAALALQIRAQAQGV